MRHSFGLGTIILVICIIFYTGTNVVIAEKISEGVAQAESGCYGTIEKVSPLIAAPTCSAFTSTMDFAGVVIDNLGMYLSQAKDEIISGIRSLSGGKDVDMDEITGKLGFDSGALQSLSSSASALADKFNQGPSTSYGGSISDQVRSTIDNYVIGQHLSDTGSVSQAIPWLQQGAATPGYGVLSQMSLGDIYSRGGGGVAADPSLAAAYYGQALQSISSLQANGSPEAQQLLRSLHGNPQEVQRQLQTMIAQLKKQH